MTAYPDLLSVWTVLSAEGKNQQAILQANPLGITIEAGEVLAALDKDLNRHLLIPLLPGEAVAEQPDGSAVRLTRVKFQSRNYISALCTVRSLDSVFTQFARELLEVLHNSTSPAQDVTRSFKEWKALFAAAAGPGLGISEQIGLLAELQLVEKLVTMGDHSPLGRWHGPEGSEHDFRSGDIAIEVKASLAREGRRIGISSVHQLEAPNSGAGQLFLDYKRYEHNQAGNSLPDVIEKVVDLGVDSSLLERKLRKVGYFDSHRDLYRDSRFTVKEHAFYDVNQDYFPRIIPSSFDGDKIPAGVASLNYVVDLTNEPPVSMSATETDDLLEGFLNVDS